MKTFKFFASTQTNQNSSRKITRGVESGTSGKVGDEKSTSRHVEPYWKNKLEKTTAGKIMSVLFHLIYSFWKSILYFEI